MQIVTQGLYKHALETYSDSARRWLSAFITRKLPDLYHCIKTLGVVGMYVSVPTLQSFLVQRKKESDVQKSEVAVGKQEKMNNIIYAYNLLPLIHVHYHTYTVCTSFVMTSCLLPDTLLKGISPMRTSVFVNVLLVHARPRATRNTIRSVHIP